MIELIKSLQQELQFALDVFEETCDCGTCGPCKRQERMRELITRPLPSILEELAKQAK